MELLGDPDESTGKISVNTQTIAAAVKSSSR